MKMFLLILGVEYPAVRQEGEDEYQMLVILIEALPSDRNRPPRFIAQTKEGRQVRVELDPANDTLVMAG